MQPTSTTNDVEVLQEHIEELRLLYGDVLNKLQEIQYQARRAGIPQVDKEITHYTQGWIEQFADDDPGSHQSGSVGSLLQAIRDGQADTDE